MTISAWLKTTSNFTLPSVALQQNFGSGGSSSVTTTAASNVSITTTWQRFTWTVAVPSIAGKTLGSGSFLMVFFNFPLSAAATLDVWGFQLEAGNVATRFEEEPYEATLRKCQRYYVRFDNTGGSNAYSLFAPSGKTESTTQAICYTPLPVAMRVVPTSVEYGGTLSVDATGGAFAPSALTMQDRSTNKVASVTYNVTGATAQQFTTVRANNSTSAYVGFSSEL